MKSYRILRKICLLIFVVLCLSACNKNSSPETKDPLKAQQVLPEKRPLKTPAEEIDPPANEGVKSFRVLYFNSLQACMLPVVEGEKKLGGLRYLAAVIQERKTPKTFLCTTGDFLQGDADDRRPVIEAMNLLGVQATTLGNLELNYGAKGLDKKLEKAKFSVVSANIYKQDAPLFSPYIMKKIGNISVAVVGIISGDAAVKASTELLGKLRFRDPLKEMGKTLEKIPLNTPVIVLSDLMREQDQEMARRYPRINLIIGRYDLDSQLGYVRIGAVSIVRLRRKRGIELGEVDLIKNGDRWDCSPPRVYNIGPETKDCKGLSVPLSIEKLVSDWQKSEKRFREVLGESKTILLGSSPAVRRQETNFGDLLADILLESRPEADIAVVNSGFIRASLPKGPIDRGTLKTALPFNNDVVELEIAGELIREMLENSVARYQKISGAFLQVAGITFSFNPNLPAFSRIIEVKVEGEPLVDDKIYHLATLSYIASGGDDYAMLRDILPLPGAKKDFREIVENYLMRKKVVNSAIEGRIRIVK